MQIGLASDYVAAAKVAKRPLLALLVEALRLRLSLSRIGLSEYIDFQLYLDDLSHYEKSAFGGFRRQSILEDILIDDYSRILSLDKMTMYSLLAAYNIPTPKIIAVYRSIRPSSVISIRSAIELEQFLRRCESLPIYLKRSFGSYGRGNVLISRIEGDNVLLGNGTTELLADFCKSLDEARTLGWIIQEALVSHSDIIAITGSTKISGLRIHTFNRPDIPEIVKAILKINLGTKDSDNFEHGTSGNMLGAVDLVTGEVFRVISGTGVKQSINPIHPVTGYSMVGFKIPFWNETLNLVKDAQAAFPGFICPGWDIALCEDGPKILEINAFGDIDLSQHAYRSGFLDHHLLSLLEGRGLRKLLYAGPGKGLRSASNGRLGVRRHHWPW